MERNDKLLVLNWFASWTDFKPALAPAHNHLWNCLGLKGDNWLTVKHSNIDAPVGLHLVMRTFVGWDQSFFILDTNSCSLSLVSFQIDWEEEPGPVLDYLLKWCEKPNLKEVSPLKQRKEPNTITHKLQVPWHSPWDSLGSVSWPRKC